ncbi:hypothetical protein D3C85_1082370 [compost metagenome]
MHASVVLAQPDLYPVRRGHGRLRSRLQADAPLAGQSLAQGLRQRGQECVDGRVVAQQSGAGRRADGHVDGLGQLGRGGGDPAVALAITGGDVPRRPGGIAQLGPQAIDQQVHAAFQRVGAATLGRIQQTLARQYPARVPHQELKRRGFRRREGDGLAPAIGGVTEPLVEYQVTEPHLYSC